MMQVLFGFFLFMFIAIYLLYLGHYLYMLIDKFIHDKKELETIDPRLDKFYFTYINRYGGKYKILSNNASLFLVTGSLIAIVAAIVWPITLIIAIIVGLLLYFRNKARKEKKNV